MILTEYSLQIEIPELKKIYTESTTKKLDWLMVAIENPPEKRFFHNYTPLRISAQSDEFPTEEEEEKTPQRGDGIEKNNDESKQTKSVDGDDLMALTPQQLYQRFCQVRETTLQ